MIMMMVLLIRRMKKRKKIALVSRLMTIMVTSVHRFDGFYINFFKNLLHDYNSFLLKPIDDNIPDNIMEISLI